MSNARIYIQNAAQRYRHENIPPEMNPRWIMLGVWTSVSLKKIPVSWVGSELQYGLVSVFNFFSPGRYSPRGEYF